MRTVCRDDMSSPGASTSAGAGKSVPARNRHEELFGALECREIAGKARRVDGLCRSTLAVEVDRAPSRIEAFFGFDARELAFGERGVVGAERALREAIEQGADLGERGASVTARRGDLDDERAGARSAEDARCGSGGQVAQRLVEPAAFAIQQDERGERFTRDGAAPRRKRRGEVAALGQRFAG